MFIIPMNRAIKNIILIILKLSNPLTFSKLSSSFLLDHKIQIEMLTKK